MEKNGKPYAVITAMTTIIAFTSPPAHLLTQITTTTAIAVAVTLSYSTIRKIIHMIMITAAVVLVVT